MNYPMAVGRKDISMMKRDFWPLKKEIKNRNDEGKFDDDQSRKINIKNLLFYHNDWLIFPYFFMNYQNQNNWFYWIWFDKMRKLSVK